MKKKDTAANNKRQTTEDKIRKDAQLHYSESQAIADHIRKEMTTLRESQAELASAMLQFLQFERQQTRRTKDTLALILTAIAVHQATPQPSETPASNALFLDIQKKLRDLYNT